MVAKQEGAQLLSGKSRFLPPREWQRWYLPFKLEVSGGALISSALQREGVISGVIRTLGGMIRLDVYNTSHNVIRITPKTPLVSIGGYKEIKIVRLIPVQTVEVEEITAESLAREMAADFPEVGDLTQHPVVPKMRPLIVRPDEMCWTLPSEQGQRTPFKTENVACRRRVKALLEDYTARGYLRKVSTGERVYFSPLLPVKKPSGDYRLTNDFRGLNAYFKRGGMQQVDVWRRLWDIGPHWKYFAKLDLKDGFYGIPVASELQPSFAFTWQDRRYAWRRLPMGWTWSSILFAERVAEIVEGLGTVQFVDDLLVGAETKEGLRQKLRKVFERLQEYGLKVNLEKTKFLNTRVTFLGIELAEGRWSLREYLLRKQAQVGRIRHWKDLERVIGALSYARRTVRHMEEIIQPLRTRLAESRRERHPPEWWQAATAEAHAALAKALDKQRFLRFPGVQAERYTLETDWSGEHAGYMLFAETKEGKVLCDLGSKRILENTSSFLGELKAVVWACKDTKAFRGDMPLRIVTDNLALAEKMKAGSFGLNDQRAVRLFGWLLGNENFTVEFVPGAENVGADLLSRPRKASQDEVEVNVLTDERRRMVEKAHAGHWNWWITYRNLKSRDQAWPGMREDVRQFVAECKRCQLYGRAYRQPAWRAWSCTRPNEVVFMDHLGPLRWESEDEPVYVLVMIDGFSRFIQLSISSGPTAESAMEGVAQWVRRNGTPAKIVSDQGSAFIADEFVSDCQLRRIEVVTTVPYAPWSNGLCERAVGTVLGRIRRCGRGENWTSLMADVAFGYNDSYHSGIKETPRVVFQGLDPAGRMVHPDYLTQARRVALEHTQRNQRLRREKCLKRVPRRRPIPLGAHVMAKVPNPGSKLGPQWEGPYRLVERVSPVLRKVVKDGVPGPSWIFHAHQLRQCVSAYPHLAC